MNNLLKPNAIIFDFDDTLVDSFKIIYQAYHSTSLYFNLPPVSIEELRNNFDMSIYFVNQWEEAQKLYLANYQALSLELSPYQDAEEILKFLKEKNIPVIIISNKRNYILRNEITNILNWDKYFDLIIGGGDTTESKPSITPVIYAETKLNFKISKNTWFIGDSIIDIECANIAGCTSILIGKMSNHISKHKYKPCFHFDNHKQILDIIKSIL